MEVKGQGPRWDEEPRAQHSCAQAVYRQACGVGGWRQQRPTAAAGGQSSGKTEEGRCKRKTWKQKKGGRRGMNGVETRGGGWMRGAEQQGGTALAYWVGGKASLTNGG